MIRHAFPLTASIGGLTPAMARLPLGCALVVSPGVPQGLAACLAPTGRRAVDLSPVAMTTGADEATAMFALNEAAGVVVVHSLSSAKG
jgi:hypothetical protein